MVIDKLKLVGGIKILALAVYLIYFIVSNTNPSLLLKIGFKPEIEL